MGVYIELPKDWAKYEITVTDFHNNELEAKVTDLDLVRCGECKYWDGIECQNDRASTDLEGGAEYALYRDDTDFCSYGERRADE